MMAAGGATSFVFHSFRVAEEDSVKGRLFRYAGILTMAMQGEKDRTNNCQIPPWIPLQLPTKCMPCISRFRKRLGIRIYVCPRPCGLLNKNWGKFRELSLNFPKLAVHGLSK